MNTLRVWLACIRLGAAHRYAYRLEVVTSLVSALMILVLNASVWRAAVSGRAHLAGLPALELGTYVIVAWTVTTVSTTRLEEHLGNRFRTGEIAAELVRPLDLQAFLVARDLGRALATLVVTAVPVLVCGALLFPIAWPTHLWTWPVVLVSVGLGVLIGAQFSFLVGLASFRLKSVSGIAQLKNTLVALLSGAVVPLDVLPDVVRPIVLALPFQGMSHTAATLFLERVPADALWRPLGVQVSWAIALFLACRLAWRRALVHLTVQGG